MTRCLVRALVLGAGLAPGCSFDSTGQSGAPDTGNSGASTGVASSGVATEASATTGVGTTDLTTGASMTGTTEPATSSTTGAPASCGDGKIDPLEECDLGPQNGPGQTCKDDCRTNVCGDGDVGPGEGCDDGNLADGDGCSAKCVLESCGNGNKDPGEACDDGNTVDDDGCTNACTLPTCGDAIVQMGEACDAGGETASCDPDCTVVECGDGTVNTTAGEACDDGNANNTDFCTSCKFATCGDGFVQMGVETCDDGNTDDGDGCSATCQLEPLRAFVSSALYKGDLGGLEAADVKCQGLADSAMLGGTWMAWLSDDASGPADRFMTKGGTQPYALVNGTKIADNWADLTDGSLDTQLNRTETGATPGAPNNVWTNTDVDGTPSSTNFCKAWSDGTGSNSGDFGERNQSDARWTKKGTANCSTASHIYCFEQ